MWLDPLVQMRVETERWFRNEMVSVFDSYQDCRGHVSILGVASLIVNRSLDVASFVE